MTSNLTNRVAKWTHLTDFAIFNEESGLNYFNGPSKFTMRIGNKKTIVSEEIKNMLSNTTITGGRFDYVRIDLKHISNNTVFGGSDLWLHLLETACAIEDVGFPILATLPGYHNLHWNPSTKTMVHGGAELRRIHMRYFRPKEQRDVIRAWFNKMLEEKDDKPIITDFHKGLYDFSHDGVHANQGHDFWLIVGVHFTHQALADTYNLHLDKTKTRYTINFSKKSLLGYLVAGVINLPPTTVFSATKKNQTSYARFNDFTANEFAKSPIGSNFKNNPHFGTQYEGIEIQNLDLVVSPGGPAFEFKAPSHEYKRILRMLTGLQNEYTYDDIDQSSGQDIEIMERIYHYRASCIHHKVKYGTNEVYSPPYETKSLLNILSPAVIKLTKGDNSLALNGVTDQIAGIIPLTKEINNANSNMPASNREMYVLEGEFGYGGGKNLITANGNFIDISVEISCSNFPEVPLPLALGSHTTITGALYTNTG